MDYTAVVPARSGSKRLPQKNVKLLAGKPLLVWTLEACVNAAQVDKVILSTDSEEYWDLANQYIDSKKLALDFRSEEEAGDKIKIFDYLKNKRDKIFQNSNGAFILALPTVPLRSAQHINEAISLYEKHNCPIFSATNYGFATSFAFSLNDDNSWSPLSNDSPMLTGNTRSQGQQETYHPNGAIYVRAIADLSQPDLTTLYENAKAYIMSRNNSVDIDNEIDFHIAETLVKHSTSH